MSAAAAPCARAVAVLFVALGTLTAAAPASALTLRARRSDVGWIALRVGAAPGTHVAVAERVGPHRRTLTPFDVGATAAVRRHAVRWRCGRRVRRFVATARTAGGATRTARATVRTPGCAHRLGVLLRPIRPRAGTVFDVRVTDRWRVGLLHGRLCVRGPGAKAARCRPVALGRDRATAAFPVRARRPGRWRTELRTAGGGRFHGGVDVRRRGTPLRLLATGDSMIQIVDSYLSERLAGRASVRSDAHVGTGISKPFGLDWVRHAAGSAAGYRPDVTVMAIGANDGFSIGGAACCGKAWIAGYTARVKRMMRAYARGGAAMVYWLTLPAPRKASFARVFRAVDVAIHRAARAFPGQVHLIDTVPVFTPGFRYRSTLCGHDGCHIVRQADGVHFNVRGASIVEGLIERAMRADGVL